MTIEHMPLSGASNVVVISQQNCFLEGDDAEKSFLLELRKTQVMWFHWLFVYNLHLK
jgi:hypothetical protein